MSRGRCHAGSGCAAAVIACLAIALGAGAPAFARQPLPDAWPLQDATPVQSAIPPGEALANVEIRPELREWVAQLDDPSFEVRETATQRLREAARNKLELYALLEQGGLTPEQRYRLLNIVREQLQERGAVGISVDQRRIPGGEVVIESLIAGLPAERVLQVGDQITHLNGRALPSWDHFRTTVQNMRPGERIQVTVRRALRGNDGRIQVNEDGRAAVEDFEVDMELGSAANLPSGGFGRRDAQGLDDERGREARDAQQRFGPTPARVSLRGGFEALIALAPPRMHDVILNDDADLEVENHPDILHLKEQLHLIEEGLLEESTELRRIWQLQLQSIALRATQPGQRRELLERVARRFAELISD